MDFDYLQNITNSPYIDEGLGDRIVSRGMSGAQRFNAMAGGEFNDLNYTKVESLFKSFIKKVSGVLGEFNNGPHSVANRLEQMRPQITPQHEQAIAQLRELAELINPSPLRQHQNQHGVLKQPNAPYDIAKVGSLVKEGLFDRDISLNTALQSNDATKILNAFITIIKNAFNGFVRDAMKVTGMPKDSVKKIAKKINPKFASAVSILDHFDVAPPVISKAQQQQQQQAQAQQPNQPVAPAAVPAPQVSPKADPKQQASKDDFASIVGNVVEIIISTVSSDVERAEKFFSKALPTDWEAPAITKEAIDTEEPEGNDQKKKGNTTKPNEIDPEDAQEDADTAINPGEFLYNFHSKYDKYPGKFAIDVTPPNKSLEIVNSASGTKKQIHVIWSSKSHENDIYVKYTTVTIGKDAEGNEVAQPQGKTGTLLLMKFWDDQVNPRVPQSKDFSVEKLLRQANPKAAQLFAEADPNSKKKAIDQQEKLLRALYATTYRKAMEFKRKLVSLTFDDEGNVFRNTKTGQIPITPEKLQAHLNSKDPKEAERWKNSLEKIGYFQKFPNKVPNKKITISTIPAAMDAVKTLKAMKVAAIPAMTAVQDAVNALGNDASAEQYVKYAFAQDKTKAAAAAGAESEKTPPAVSAEPTASVSAPVSAPASAPLPKSEPAQVSAPVSAPVSIEKPTPDPTGTSPGEKELGKASWDNNGIITWTKPGSNKEIKLTPKQLGKMSVPRLELLLQKQGYFDKFPAAKKGNLTEDIINPFDLSNMI